MLDVPQWPGHFFGYTTAGFSELVARRTADSQLHQEAPGGTLAASQASRGAGGSLLEGIPENAASQGGGAPASGQIARATPTRPTASTTSSKTTVSRATAAHSQGGPPFAHANKQAHSHR